MQLNVGSRTYFFNEKKGNFDAEIRYIGDGDSFSGDDRVELSSGFLPHTK